MVNSGQLPQPSLQRPPTSPSSPQLTPQPHPHPPSLLPPKVNLAGRRSSSDEPLSVTSSRSIKVPIPRLRGSVKSRDELSTSGADSKNRVSHACEPCRQRKTKCSGERPGCKHCQDFKISCYYADGKRDRAKNEMISLKSKVEVYEHLLEELRTHVDSAGQLAIAKALQGHRSSKSDTKLDDQSRDGESLVSAEVGSTGSIDHIKEEINADNAPYPTGYMGKSSEVTWIQRVAQQLAKEAESSSSPDGEGIYASESSRTSSYSCPSTKRQSNDSVIVDEEYQFQTPAYHLDDLSVSISGGQLDPYLLPDKKIADELISAYFTTFYPSFPIVSKKLFMAQYDTFFENFFPPGSSKRWLAMLNLMLAIGALYAKLIDAEWKGGNTEHLKYFGRARILYLDDGGMFEVADLQQVQVIGLAGMYLLASNQTNRSWNVIGLAIRFAQTLGLNLRNDIPDFEEVEKELRVRMWFALYSIENLLCPMTGRPACVQDRDCSVPLPRPIEEDASGLSSFDAALRQYTEEYMLTPLSNSNSGSGANSTPPSLASLSHACNNTPKKRRNTPDRVSRTVSTTPAIPQMVHTIQGSFPQSLQTSNTVPRSAGYFLEHTKLNKIISIVLSQLYSPDTINRSWSDIQGIISALELSIVKWKADLPVIWDFGRAHRDASTLRERMSLAFQYHNARILINRPCLCRLDFRIPNESNRSRDFNRSAAATCIGGARETVALLPDEPNPTWLFSVAPWWCLLHYLVSAGAILMVEISMRAEHNPQQADGLLKDAKKIVRWLRAMSRENIAAERSWAVLTKLLIVSAPKIGGDTSDVERDLGDADRSAAVKRRDTVMQDGGTPTEGTNKVAFRKSAHRGVELNAAATAASPTSNLGAAHVQDLFRGLLDDPFPFGNIPIHSPFDNMMDVPEPAQPPLFSAAAPPSALAEQPFPTPPSFSTLGHSMGVFSIQNLAAAAAAAASSPNTHPPPTTTAPPPQPQAVVPSQTTSHLPIEPHDPAVVDRSMERLQKRLSLGVSNISMPPPVQFSPWLTTDDFDMNQQQPGGTNYFKASAEQRRADLDTAVKTLKTGQIDEIGSVGGSSTLPGDKSRKWATDDQ